MFLAAQSGVAGDLETAKQHYDAGGELSEQASKLLIKGFAYFKR